MASKEYTFNICKLGKKSHRGYYFTEPEVRAFIDSDAWRIRKDDHTALCSITHKSRRRPEDLSDTKYVGQRDYQLVDQTCVGTVTDLFIEDGYWRAKVQIFDPDDFKGSDAEKDISFINGLINSGVKPKTSAGIEAYYNNITKHADVIYDFVGLDFTQSPDFGKDSGMI